MCKLSSDITDWDFTSPFYNTIPSFAIIAFNDNDFIQIR